MQYQVPQFIDTEDKLIGPFSLRQFIFVGAAGVVCGIAYFFVQTWLFVIITIIALGGAFAFAFLKINGRPLIKVATSAFNYYWKPQTYIWKPDHPAAAQRPSPPALAVHQPVPASENQGRLVKARHSSPAAPALAAVTASAAPPASADTRALPPVRTIAQGDSLHRSWENLQTGTPDAPENKKTSDRQFLEKKMAERYQILQGELGDRTAARRVDYR